MTKKFVSVDASTGTSGEFRRGFQVESVTRLVNDSDPSGADEPLEVTLETPGARPDETIRLNAGEEYPGPVPIRVVRIVVESPNGADVPFRAEGTITEGKDLRKTPGPESGDFDGDGSSLDADTSVETDGDSQTLQDSDSDGGGGSNGGTGGAGGDPSPTLQDPA